MVYSKGFCFLTKKWKNVIFFKITTEKKLKKDPLFFPSSFFLFSRLANLTFYFDLLFSVTFFIVPILVENNWYLHTCPLLCGPMKVIRSTCHILLREKVMWLCVHYQMNSSPFPPPMCALLGFVHLPQYSMVAGDVSWCIRSNHFYNPKFEGMPMHPWTQQCGTLITLRSV